jgi:hypothetical protein
VLGRLIVGPEGATVDDTHLPPDPPTDEPIDGEWMDGPDAERVLRRLEGLRASGLPPEVRERHLARIRSFEPATTTRTASRKGLGRRQRRLAPVAAASLALLLVASGGTAALARDAVPDDALYGLKRTAEQAWVAVPRGAGQAAELQLVLAARRLEEAGQAPAHADRLIAEGVDNVEAAAEERPEQALESLARLLGDGPDRLPDQASPRARSSLHRNCLRIAARHGLDDGPCGAAPPDLHPGKGHPGKGQGRAEGRANREGKTDRKAKAEARRGQKLGGAADGAEDSAEDSAEDGAGDSAEDGAGDSAEGGAEDSAAGGAEDG